MITRTTQIWGNGVRTADAIRTHLFVFSALANFARVPGSPCISPQRRLLTMSNPALRGVDWMAFYRNPNL
jgi:hypothetical protein